jgi:transposase
MASFEAQISLLVTIPGVERTSAQELIAEIGIDMDRFGSAERLASWAGMCPGHHESAGKQHHGRARPGPKWLQRCLSEAGKAAGRSKGTYLGAQYARLRGRRGPAKATKAVGHSILVAAFHMLRDGASYHDLGPDWFGRLRPQQHARRLVHQLQALGYTVTITADAA